MNLPEKTTYIYMLYLIVSQYHNMMTHRSEMKRKQKENEKNNAHFCVASNMKSSIIIEIT